MREIEIDMGLHGGLNKDLGYILSTELTFNKLNEALYDGSISSTDLRF